MIGDGLEPHDQVTRWASEVELIDHQGVDWGRGRQTRYWMHERIV